MASAASDAAAATDDALGESAAADAIASAERRREMRDARSERRREAARIVYGDERTEWYGTAEWLDPEGRRHRDGDEPAVVMSSGTKMWYQHGKLHRADGRPAIEWSTGCKWWYAHGKRHREGGLHAIEWASGDKWWYTHDKLHRDHGLPAIESADGGKQWYVDGDLRDETDVSCSCRLDVCKEDVPEEEYHKVYITIIGYTETVDAKVWGVNVRAEATQKVIHEAFADFIRNEVMGVLEDGKCHHGGKYLLLWGEIPHPVPDSARRPDGSDALWEATVRMIC